MTDDTEPPTPEEIDQARAWLTSKATAITADPAIPTEPAPTPNQFLAWLNGDKRSPLPDQLDAAFRDVVESVVAQGRKGGLVLKVVVKPGRTDLGDVEVVADVVTKLPRPPAEGRTYFPTKDGGLSRHDPHQQTLLDRDTNQPRSDLR